MSAVANGTVTINADNNAGLAGIGTGIGLAGTQLGTGLNTGLTQLGKGYNDGLTAYGKSIEAYGTTITAANTTDTVYEWVQRLLLPAIQAAAQILILDKQKSYYDEIAQKQQDLVTQAVDAYIGNIGAALSDATAGANKPPKAAAYVPVDWCKAQQDIINCHAHDVDLAAALAEFYNVQLRAQQTARLVSWTTAFATANACYEQTYQDLLKGKSPVGDVLEVMTDVAEQRCFNGRVGRSCKTTLQALGVSKLRAQAEGRKAFGQHMDILERVAPVSTNFDMNRMFTDPKDIFQLMFQQAQVVQNSLQNIYNAQTAGDPRALARMQVRLAAAVAQLQAESSKANMTNQFVPNYSAILAPQIQSITEGIFGTGGATQRNSITGAGTRFDNGLIGFLGGF